MKKITVIGADGVVGKTLVEFFTNLGHEVFSVDRDTEWTLQKAVVISDIVFVVILPIENVGQLINEAVSLMQPGSLLIHGTSIEKPLPNEIDPAKALASQITFCHLHFQFRPEVPLSTTLFGQHMTMSGIGGEWEKWQKWIHEQFDPPKPFIHELKIGEHDQITSVSQVMHMLTALLVVKVWLTLSEETVRMAMQICGPPGRFLIRSVLRVGTGAKVTESVLFNHPQTLSILNSFIEATKSLRSTIKKRGLGSLANMLTHGRGIVEPKALTKWDTSTAQLARFEADSQESRLVFRFSRKENSLGLLARILGEFDKRRIDKTTTMAQVNPDGGCTIIVGIKELNDKALEAQRTIESWIKK